MKNRLYLASACLGAIWLGSTGVLLFFVAGLASIPALLLASVALSGAFVLLLAICLVSNTRRPWANERDPFGQTSEALLRTGVMVGDRPYGRRGSDDAAVVKRLIGKFEAEVQRPPPASAPAWAAELLHDQAEQTFIDRGAADAAE
jgi:hypothetical protein